MICVVTPTYLTSPWCAAEIGAAQALGSEILPVRASSEPLDDRLLTTTQYVDVVRDASDGRDRLRLRLSIIDGTGLRARKMDRTHTAATPVVALDLDIVTFADRPRPEPGAGGQLLTRLCGHETQIALNTAAELRGTSERFFW